MPEPDATPTESLLDGRYRLGECLGRGGMADVYRAEDVLLGREVAVKMIRPGVDGVAAPERARGEVSALAALNHPSLVTLLDARLDNAEQEYLVMELVEGPTLSQRVAESPLPPQEAARLACEIAEALHVVHSAGIVHRDIKPSNVLLSPSLLPGREYRAKLADFGIAYLVDTTRVTTPGQLIGTAAYLAPEQVSGAEPAPPADVYALGLVLLESLTGQPAFPHAGGVATAIARLNAPPEIPAWLGAEWTTLLQRMTRIDPAERPTALEVAVETARLATGVHASAAAYPTLAAGIPTEVIAAAPAATLGATAPAAAASTAADPVTRMFEAASIDTDAVAPASRKPSRRRRAVLVGTTAAGVAAVLAVGLWGTGALGGPATPASTEPAVTEPSVAPTRTAAPETEPTTTPVVAGNTEDQSDAQQEAAERAREEQEEAHKRAEDEARTQAEEAQRQAEEAQRQAEEAAAEEAEQAEEAEEVVEEEPAAPADPPAEETETDPAPAPSAPSTTAPSE